MIRLFIITVLMVSFSGISVAQEFGARRESELASYSQNMANPLEMRVSAARALRGFDGPNALIAVSRASRDSEVEMRLAAIDAAAHWSITGKWDLLYPLTSDPEFMVQKSALYALLAHWQEFDKPMKLSLEHSLEMLEAQMPTNIESELELAWVEQATGKIDEAEARLIGLSKSIEDVRVILGLSKVQLQNQGELKASATLQKGIEIFPGESLLYYELAKIDHAKGDELSAAKNFETAHSLSPENSTYTYTFAVAIKDSDPDRAIDLFSLAYQRSQDPIHLYAQCDRLLATKKEATSCIEELKQVAPDYIVQNLISLYL
ncbi:hypothetical protein [Vibrio agarivorans]|uniref:Tetratricopeptide repeat protein n=1 Tax=Vibrio agarivorans TaxID=153622 RepID=A0ABT7XZI5_9VIBR|nr:hypothetical protein [Vibrio agarivorans]MDN2481185.1 hypothetical protein [Vibrio agarivorans]